MSEIITAVYQDYIRDSSEDVGGTIFQLSDPITKHKTIVVRMGCNQEPPPNCLYANQRSPFGEIGIAECLIKSSSVYSSEIVLCGKIGETAQKVEKASDPYNLREKAE